MGRGVGLRLPTALDEGAMDTPSTRQCGVSNSESPPRQIPWHDAHPVVAHKTLVVSAPLNRHSRPQTREQPLRDTEAVARSVRTLLRQSPVFDIDRAVTTAIVEQNKGNATPSLMKGIDLLRSADEPSTIQQRQGKFTRFILFCDEDGHDPFHIDECDVIAYLGWPYEEGKVGPSSVAHYVSAINTTLRAFGVTSPCNIYTAARQRILKARRGYQKMWKQAPALPQLAMPFDAIYDIAHAARRALDRGVTGVARDCTAIVFQFYTFGRPGLSSRFETNWIIECNENGLVYEIPAVTPGRKAKNCQKLRLERHFVEAQAQNIFMHPLQLLYKWMQIRKQWGGIYLFALRDEGRTPTRGDQAARLTRAFRVTRYDSDRALRITPHAIRGGAASCAYYTGVRTPILKHHADWSQTSLVFERDYLDISHKRDGRSALWFADLAN